MNRLRNFKESKEFKEFKDSAIIQQRGRKAPFFVKIFVKLKVG